MREKSCKNLSEKRQKIFGGALPSWREREKYEKSFEKVFESVKTLFLKNLNHDVRLIENQIGSIEILEKQLFRKIT